MDAYFLRRINYYFRSKCKKTKQTNKQVIVEALNLDLEDLKQGKSDGGRKNKKLSSVVSLTQQSNISTNQ